VHNIAPIASGIARAGADYVAIDGLRGGTGAAPTMIRNNVGIPIELAIAAVDTRLRQEGIRNQASLVAAGSIRNSADVIKAIALGADAVYIGTSALVAMGCHLCQKCYTGKCNWGIATQDPYLTKRLNPEHRQSRLANLLRGWSLEIKEMLGGMGINAIESLRGNRDHCDSERCVGCWMCIMICPAGAIRRNSDDKAATKCDLCAGRDVPVCVENCPNEALVVEDEE
jgi:glutamate synthase domain-containing protein 2